MRLVSLVLAALLWGGLMWSALMLQHTTLFDPHVMCGGWGCGTDKPEALLATHTFWLVLLAGGAILLAAGAPKRTVRDFGITMIVVGIIALAALITWDAVELHRVYQQYPLQRLLFTTATAVDVPALQCVILGVGLLIASRSEALLQRPTSGDVEHHTF